MSQWLGECCWHQLCSLLARRLAVGLLLRFVQRGTRGLQPCVFSLGNPLVNRAVQER